jgi:ATP-binding cassette subfamily F protein 3
VLQAPTWLALDEPTNHLDLPGRTALEEALSEFTGAMLFVSHDRAFLDGLCTHILEVGDEDEPGGTGVEAGSSGGARRPPRRVRLVLGNYSEWHARVLRERGERQVQRKEDAPRIAAAAVAAEKYQREEKDRRDAGAGSAVKGAGEREAAPKGGDQKGVAPERVRNPFRFKKLEQRIIELEAELRKLHEEVSRPDIVKAPDKLKAASRRLAEVEQELAAANHEWENWG